MIRFLDLAKQYQFIKQDIDQAIANVIADTAFVGGKYVKGFEDDFSAYLGVGNTVAVGNGTDALELAIEALGLPDSSEIIVPGNSFIATSEAVTRCGHRVVFADVDQGNYTLTRETIEAKFTDKTSAVIVVHLYGHPCDMDPIMAFAREHGLKVIEDCAQSVGATYKGKMTGGLGDVATFSFYPGKNLGAYGDAGAVVSNSQDIADLSRKIANHGRIKKYDHDMEGRNSRMDGIQAAILSVKLKHLEQWTETRINVAETYKSELSGIEGLVLPKCEEWARHVYHLYVVRAAERDRLGQQLNNANIQTGIHYPIALPKLPAYAYLGEVDQTMFVNQVDQELLSLPMGDHLNAEEVSFVASAVRSFSGVGA